MTAIDTSTSNGFRAGREALRLSDSALGILLGIDRRTIKRWEAGNPPHPTAAAMLRGMLGGYQPRGANLQMTGEELAAEMDRLDLDFDATAKLFDVPDETLSLWLSDDRGPTPIAIRALQWYEDGWRPK